MLESSNGFRPVTSVSQRAIEHRENLLQTICLLAFSVIAAAVIPRHIGWPDEAQSWLMARDSGLFDLIWRHVRYEGSPGLWATLLWLCARIHLTYGGIHWVCGLIALAGVGVWLRYAPFPPIIRYLFPFTFFIQYQYTVIARSYVLFPLLAFSLCALFTSEKPRYLYFALAAGLMANVSLYGLCFSIGIVVAYIWYCCMRGKKASTTSRHLIVYSSLLLLSFWVIAVVTAFPPSDADGSGRPALLKHLGVSQSAVSLAISYVKPLDPPQNLTQLERTYWITTHPGIEQPSKLDRMELRLFSVLGLITFPICNWNVIAVLFLILSGIFLWRQDIIYLLPYFMVLAFCIFVRAESHHTGLLWISLVCALWLAWRQANVSSALRHALTAVFVCVLAIQIGWTIHSLKAEFERPYSGDKLAAEFLKSQPAGKRIAGFHYYSVGPQAYQFHNAYINQSTTFWPWSTIRDPDLYIAETATQHPDIVIIGESYTGSQMTRNQWMPMALIGLKEVNSPAVPYFESLGYRQTHQFCGESGMRFGYSRSICYIVLEPFS
jgi:hypothetical protein